MKKHLRVLCLTNVFLLFSIQSIFAQQVAQIGTGTEVPANTLYAPIYAFSSSSTTRIIRSNTIYTATELNAVGIVSGVSITKIAYFKVGSGGKTTADASLKIYMANTSNQPPLTVGTPWSTVLSSHTLVYENNAQTIPTTAGVWVEFTLSSPFVYTGGSLEIAFDYDRGPTFPTDKFDWQYTNGFSGHIIGGTSTSATPPPTLNGTISAYKHRPNIQITYSAGACSSPPTAGTTVSSETTACSGQSFSLSLSGASFGSGQTLQWQSSPDNQNWTDISGATQPSFTTTQSSTTWYRCALTCNGNTSFSTPVQVVTDAPFAGTITVGGTGANFPTLTAALNSLQCSGISGNVTIQINQDLNEQVTITNIAGTSANKTITIKGKNRKITFATTSASRHLIRLSGAKHIIIDSLILETQGTTNNFAVMFANSADSNIIRNCKIDLTSTASNTGTTNAGIVFSGSNASATTGGNPGNNNLIENNEIIGGYYGISLAGLAATPHNNNRIVNNIIRDFYVYGIYSIQSNGLIISKNDISRANRENVGSFYGIFLTTNSFSSLVEKNRIHDTHNSATSQTGAAYGLYLTDADAAAGQENIFANNILYNFNSSSGSIYGIYNSGSNGHYIYHNTIDINNPASTSGLAYGIYQTTTATNIRILNNIVTINRGGTGTKVCLYFSTSTSQITSNRNVLFNNSIVGSNIGYYTNLRQSLAAWQSANNNAYDQNSISVDPIYVSSNTGSLMPLNTAVDNIGANLISTVSDDILGQLRTTTPDPGAYELSVGCLPPLSLKAKGITASQALLTWKNINVSTIQNWQIEWALGASFTIGTGTRANNITDTAYLLTGLMPQTTYSYYVRTICGSTDTSIWTGPFSFRTACTAFNAPFTENFDIVTASAIPQCWTATLSNTTGIRIVSTNSTNPFSLPNHIEMYNAFSVGSLLLLVSPEINNLSNGAVAVRFYAKTANTENLIVGTMSDPNDAATFLPSQTISTLNSTYQPFQVSFANLPANHKHIAFRHGSSNTARYIYLDNIEFISLPPNDLGVSKFITPAVSCGLNNANTVQVTIKNYGFAPQSNFPVNYRVNNGTVVTQLFTGTVHGNDSANMTFSVPANLSLSGIHTIRAWTSLSGDASATNDSSLVRVAKYITPTPLVNFTGFNGGNIGQVFIGWREAKGSSFINSNWSQGTIAGNTTAAVSMQANQDERMVMPETKLYGFPKLYFKTALTGATNFVQTDTFSVIASTNCGASWTALRKYTKDSTFTNTLTEKVIDLSTFANLQVMIAFRMQNGANPSAYLLHLDDVQIRNEANPDITVVEIISPTLPFSVGAVQNLVFRVQNIGTSSIAPDPNIQIVAKVTDPFGGTIAIPAPLFSFNDPAFASGTTKVISVSPYAPFSQGIHNICGIVIYNADQDSKNDTLCIDLNATTPSSLEQVVAQKSTVQIYPNPNNGTFTVQLNNWTALPTDIELLDLTGKVIAKKNADTQTEIIFNENQLERGMYLIRVSNPQHTVVNKVIIR